MMTTMFIGMSGTVEGKQGQRALGHLLAATGHTAPRTPRLLASPRLARKLTSHQRPYCADECDHALLDPWALRDGVWVPVRVEARAVRVGRGRAGGGAGLGARRGQTERDEEAVVAEDCGRWVLVSVCSTRGELRAPTYLRCC